MSKVKEAQEILRAFDFDRRRTHEASARTLLALAGMNERTSWADATNERMGVRAILDWMRGPLNHPIAENSRETVRRFVLHQFVDAGFCLYNDDDPGRATNSSKNNYRLSPEALLAIQQRIPVTTPDGEELALKAGGQNTLIKAMVEDFCAYFVPGGEVLYIGDADSKLTIFENERLASLGVTLDLHGKFPDLIVYQPDRNWLLLMEACSTHGPVDHIRHSELSEIFHGCTAGLIYVSCFPNRTVMRRFLVELAWETEAWVASDPTHMIHLNGSKFLGPHGGD